MKRIYRKSFLVAATALMFGTQSHAQKLALVFGTDKTTASDFKTRFEMDGLVVDTIPYETAYTHDFSNYSVIVISPEARGVNNTSGHPSVAHLKSTNKPMLAWGMGGLALFDEFKNRFVNWGRSAGIGSDSSKALISNDSLVSYPNTVTLSKTGNIKLNVNAFTYQLYMPTLPDSVKGIMQSTSNPSYYVSAIEKGKYGFWGYNNSLGTATEEGVKYFKNLVYFLGKIKKPVSTSIINEELKNLVGIYPNPTQDHLYISLPNVMEANVSITNSLSQTIFYKEISGIIKLELPESAEGVVYVKISTGGKHVVEKIVVNR